MAINLFDSKWNLEIRRLKSSDNEETCVCSGDNDGPTGGFVTLFIKIWIGDIYDISMLIFVFLLLKSTQILFEVFLSSPVERVTVL